MESRPWPGFRSRKTAHKHKIDLTNHGSGIPLILGLRTRMYDPYVHVVFGTPIGFRHGELQFERVRLASEAERMGCKRCESKVTAF